MLAQVLVAAIAALHVWILTLEMFLWTRPHGLKTFGNTKEKAEETAVLAANQGLYNGFLAAGLLWGLVATGRTVETFFLTCVLFAGVFGGLTAKRSILYVQALPAAIALVVLWAS
jgi:putative membrane protein